MRKAKVTSKGQITVPKEIREHLGVNSGDRLSFVIRDSGEVLVEAEVSDIRALKGILPLSDRARTLEEMEDAIARGSSDSR